MHTLKNHPVNILNKKGDYASSAFIPFCSFGEELIGVKKSGFEQPVCDIFKPKNHHDQVCFETDLEKLRDKDNLRKQLEMGLTLILDYNEERQLSSNSNAENRNHNSENSFSIHLNTIGMIYKENYS